MVLNGFICEGPRCNKGSSGRPVLVQWDAAQNDPAAMPDDFFKFIGVRPIYEEPTPTNQGQQPKERTFCSAGCLRDYFNESHYAPPRSPREQAVQAEANAKVVTRDGFGKPKALGSRVIPFPRSSQEPVAVDQADGAGNNPTDGASNDLGPVLA